MNGMILVLTGSPNKNGNTNRVLREVLKDQKEEVFIYDAFENNVKGCTDCLFCSRKSGCSIKDDMFDIYNALDQATTLIIASPLYFATLTGELINLLSRFQTYYAGKYVRKVQNPHIKKALFIVTAGGYWPTMFNGVKETFRIMQLLFQIDETKELLISNCDTIKPLESDAWLKHKEDIRQFINK